MFPHSWNCHGIDRAGYTGLLNHRVNLSKLVFVSAGSPLLSLLQDISGHGYVVDMDLPEGIIAVTAHLEI